MADSSLCSGCGAMLPLPDLSGTATCPSCGRTTRGRPSGAEDQDEGRPTPPAADEPLRGGSHAAGGLPPLRPPPPGRRRSRRGARLAVLGALAVIGLAGAIAALAVASSDSVRARLDPNASPYDSLIVLGGTAQLLPSAGDGIDVIATVQEVDGGSLERRIARIRFTGATAELVWQSDPVDDGASRAAVALGADTLFIGLDDEVAALDPDDGTLRWRTELRDTVTTGCPDCFAVVGGRLVVRTTDAYLTGFGPTSAEQQWTRRLRSPSASVSVANDRLVVIDDPAETGGSTQATVLDPATGRDASAAAVACAPGEGWPTEVGLSPRDEVRAVPGSDDVVAAFGFGRGCAARWNPDDGTVRWATALPDVSTVDPESVVVDGSVLALPVSGGAIAVVDLDTGAARSLEPPPDTTATPAVVVDGIVVGETITSRGSRRGGLAGWDAASGELRWTLPAPSDAEPVEVERYGTTVALFDGSPRSVLVPTGDGVSIVVFDGGERTYSVTPVATGSGRLGTEVRRDLVVESDLGIPSLGPVGSDGERLVVTIDSVLEAIPVGGTGEVLTFPPLR